MLGKKKEGKKRGKKPWVIFILDEIIHIMNKDDWWVLWYWINANISKQNLLWEHRLSYNVKLQIAVVLQITSATLIQNYFWKPFGKTLEFVRDCRWIFYKSVLWSACLSCTDWLFSTHSTWNIKGIMLSGYVHCNIRKILQNLLFIKANSQKGVTAPLS